MVNHNGQNVSSSTNQKPANILGMTDIHSIYFAFPFDLLRNKMWLSSTKSIQPRFTLLSSAAHKNNRGWGAPHPSPHLSCSCVPSCWAAWSLADNSWQRMGISFWDMSKMLGLNSWKSSFHWTMLVDDTWTCWNHFCENYKQNTKCLHIAPNHDEMSSW